MALSLILTLIKKSLSQKKTVKAPKRAAAAQPVNK